MKQIKNVQVEDIGFHEGLQRELSTYSEKTIQEDGSVSIERVHNPYFLINNDWDINFVGEIKQFREQVTNNNYANKNIHFQFSNPSINLEVKYVYYQQLFNDLWTVKSIFMNQSPLKRMTEFLNEKYPKLLSLLDLDIDIAEREYLFWLNENGVNTLGKDGVYKSSTARFIKKIYTLFFQYTDKREEWEKDRWDVRVLHDKYGIDYNKSITMFYIDFSNIDQNIREKVKGYVKQRLLSKNRFSWSTARNYLTVLPNFFTFIFSLEPTWKDLKALKRTHIVKYIEYLNEYAKNKIKLRNVHPEHYVSKTLSIIQKFLEDIQRYEYEMAPETHVRLLIFPDDKPKQRKKSIDQIDYIPDSY